MKNTLLFLFAILLAGCRDTPTTLFTSLTADDTGITFNNRLKEDSPDLSILNYPYFYNGGGVAVGDFNNDGLMDLVFTGNEVKNALYINRGGLRFEDHMAKSGIADQGGWCTGVTVMDINHDGWQDIYICRSAWPNVRDRKNLLLINRGDLTFTESAAAYGLDDPGYSTQASFFDYDLDGDLDMFLINQSDPKYSRGNLDYMQSRDQEGDSTLNNKLFRNDQGHFVNVSKKAGIDSHVFSYSLGLSTADINQDGWPDIYVGNDFEEADYLYINQQNGTFREEATKRLDHTSLFSMGIDVADYNNDLLPDVLQMDMLPEGNRAQKMHLAADNYNRYTQQFEKGMFPQYMKNALQKNNGDGTFSEVAQLAGVARTDWSWSPLMADFDNDGNKDFFITNGYQRDNTDMQFVVYAMDQSQHIQRGGQAPAVQDYIAHMPGIHLPNYIFKNEGNDHFSNQVKAWGLGEPTYSHGAAYADLDNDGDLELIINNTASPAGIFRNNSNLLAKNNYLRIQLTGRVENKTGIGARIYAYAGPSHFYLEQNPVRGYQSSGDPILHLGLGATTQLDSVVVVWPGGLRQRLTNVKANQTLSLNIADAAPAPIAPAVNNTLLTEVQAIDFTHQETVFNDFSRQFLLPYSLSHDGPAMAKGDVNGDGKADLFIGGGPGQSGALFVQSENGSFKRTVNTAFALDAASTDRDAAFFDADGDGDLDLYVVSGGYQLDENSPLLQDRFYLNDGKGHFEKTAGRLEKNLANKKCVRPVDFDQDGDLDLFVGGSVVPGRFPLSAPSKIYFNDGKGNFTTHKPANAQLGIVNDALWLDLDKDGKKDLIVAGEWTPLRAYRAQGALFTDVSTQWFPFASNGWWRCIAHADFDHDGDEDLVVGNEGLNSPLQVTATQPMRLYYADWDGNGSIDPIMTYYNGDEDVPLPLRDDLIGQVPLFKKKFNDYNSYAVAGIKDILAPEQLSKASVLSVNMLKTVYLENTGTSFVPHELPVEAQFAPVFAVAAADVDGDGNPDIVLSGNQSRKRIFLGRDDANHGLVLLGDGKGHFRYVSQQSSGLNVRGDVRSVAVDGDELIFGVNNAAVKTYRMTRRQGATSQGSRPAR